MESPQKRGPKPGTKRVSSFDPEIAAIRKILAILKPLDAHTQDRVMAYASDKAKAARELAARIPQAPKAETGALI